MTCRMAYNIAGDHVLDDALHIPGDQSVNASLERTTALSVMCHQVRSGEGACGKVKGKTREEGGGVGSPQPRGRHGQDARAKMFEGIQTEVCAEVDGGVEWEEFAGAPCSVPVRGALCSQCI